MTRRNDYKGFLKNQILFGSDLDKILLEMKTTILSIFLKEKYSLLICIKIMQISKCHANVCSSTMDNLIAKYFPKTRIYKSRKK